MLDKPSNIKPRKGGRLIVIIGIAAILFIVAANQMQSVAQMIVDHEMARP